MARYVSGSNQIKRQFKLERIQFLMTTKSNDQYYRTTHICPMTVLAFTFDRFYFIIFMNMYQILY